MGLRHTTLDDPAGLLGDRAAGHARDRHFRYITIQDHVHDGLRLVSPAAGGWSTAEDLGRFVADQARHCEGSGSRDCERARTLGRSLHAVVGPARGYALGWFVDRSRGTSVLSHSGDAAGFSAEFGVLPEYEAGFVILLNGGDAQAVIKSFRARLFAEWFNHAGEPANALSTRLTNARLRAETLLEDVEEVPASVTGSVVGRYASATLGGVVIAATRDGLQISTESWTSEMGYVPGNREHGPALAMLDPPLVGQRLELGEGELRYANDLFWRVGTRGP